LDKLNVSMMRYSPILFIVYTIVCRVAVTLFNLWNILPTILLRFATLQPINELGGNI